MEEWQSWHCVLVTELTTLGVVYSDPLTFKLRIRGKNWLVQDTVYDANAWKKTQSVLSLNLPSGCCTWGHIYQRPSRGPMLLGCSVLLPVESLVNNSSTGFAHWGGRVKEVPGAEGRLGVEEGEGQELRDQDFLRGTGGGGRSGPMNQDSYGLNVWVLLTFICSCSNPQCDGIGDRALGR